MMSYDKNNIFAKILRGETPAVKVHEDAKTLTFMDLFPQSRGHTLIIPKVEATTILDCPADALATLITMTQRVAKAIDAAIKPDGIMIAQFNRSAAGQSVPHLHFHVIPRYTGQVLKVHFASGNKADPGELEQLAAKIRAAL
jgi:histidine triad (HIT) family protein